MTRPDHRALLRITAIALLTAAAGVLCITRLPLPLRPAVMGTDLIGAAIIFLALRQNRSS